MTTNEGTQPEIKPGDFSGLAADYARNRPDYSRHVLNALVGLLPRGINETDFADVGAGTGIWTRMVSSLGPRSCTAIEPNADMLNQALSHEESRGISWRAGTAEETGLGDKSVDFVSMASSFHWANFERSIHEFHRILREDGWFTCLWNPRSIESDSLLCEIENYLYVLHPKLERVSSGKSTFTERLSERIPLTGLFSEVVYMESKHEIVMTRERYLGAWRSVNDVRVQLGADSFQLFLDFVDEITADLPTITSTYLTRAWAAQRLTV